MADYLLEIGTEEIPAKFMPPVLEQLKGLAEKKLAENRIKYGKIETCGTPRRITLLIYNLHEKGEDIKEEVRGPGKKAAFTPDGQPTKAAEGFARSQGVAVDRLLLKDTGNGEYIFAEKEIAGKKTSEVLPLLAVELINGLSFPKPMRWSDKEMRFARPIHWLVSLLDNEVVPFEVEGLHAGKTSRGHRFLGHESITIMNPQQYITQMKKEFVVVDPAERKKECWRQIEDIAAQAGGTVEPDEELLEEVTYLLEWPTALMGSFPEKYLDIPEEVVITPMREHQRYFPVRDEKGKLMNRFITVRNGNAEHLGIVRAGNERVLKARLADAGFFWDEDKKIKLEAYLPRLEKIVFQESLGTVAAKIARFTRTVDELSLRLTLEPSVRKNALRAAALAKADLVTNMVYEFPELQGIMGRYYARLSGENEAVAQAILEHYQPRFAQDAIPASPEGALVSIADKIDTIAGCFALGFEPTGSQDPYALRRQAMGICQILLGHNLKLRIDDLVQLALDNYKGVLNPGQLGEETHARIMEFFQARLRNILSEAGHRYDVIDAALGVDYASPVLTLARACALSEMKEDAKFLSLLTSFVRAYNLAKKTASSEIDPASFIDEAEKTLYRELLGVKKIAEEHAAGREFTEAIRAMSTLTAPVSSFFEAVMVMADDDKVRQNRLGLLVMFVDITRLVGDLSKIVLG